MKNIVCRFIDRAAEIHPNKYDYSKVEYMGAKNKVCIVCKTHGEFWQTPSNHLLGHGCKVCGKEKKVSGINDRVKNNRPDVSQLIVPDGSIAIPVGTNGMYALVDDEDYYIVSRYNWCSSLGYAKNDKVGYMHRFIMDTPDGMVTDHINHNTLDNRKTNLRVCSISENTKNMISNRGTSKYKGVYWNNRLRRWCASIMNDSIQFNIGSFSSELEAAKAYDENAKLLHGEFAHLNF